MRRLFFIAGGWLMALSAVARVSSADTLKHNVVVGDTVHAMREVTVRGHRMPSSLLSSVPVQMLSRSEMLRMGAVDVGDALKHFAGVQVKDYGGVGGLKTVNIRGLGAQHVGVSYDGVQVGDCQSGQVDLSRFTLGNISSVLLTIGQGDDIYMSAKSYASAAVIEIRSVEDERPFSLNFGQSVGSYGLYSPSFFVSKRLGKLSVSGYANYERADGNYRFKLWNGSKLIAEKRNNSDIEAWRGEINLMYRLSKRQSITWKLYGYDSHRGLPGSVVYDNTYAAERLTDKNVFTQLQFENVFSERIKLKAAAKWNYSWNRDRDMTAGGQTEDIYRQNETYLTATFWTEPAKGLHVSLAQDFAHNYLSMTLRDCPYPTRNSSWTALAANYSGLKNLTFNASVLGTYIHESVKRGEPSDGFHRLSPAFSMQWRAMRNLRVRVGYKDIFRTPTLNDLYYTGVGRRSLKPENTRQWNLGLTWSTEKSASGNFIALTLDGYYGRVTDKIVAVPRMFLWQMMNVGKVRMLGVDATTAANIALAKGWEAGISATYNYMNATDRTAEGSMNYGDQIAYTPEHSGSGSVTLHSPFVDVTYNLLVTGRRYMLGYDIAENKMGGFTDHSVSIYRKFNIGECRLGMQLDVKNIGGKNYEVVRFYPMPGTNVLFTLNLEY